MFHRLSVNSSILIDPGQLRIGMYVQLDIGWMHHPFPVSRFRIVSADQITTLRGLGLTKVRYFPDKSDLGPDESAPPTEAEARPPEPAPSSVEAPETSLAAQRRDHLRIQNHILAVCNQRFGEATQQYKSLERAVAGQPAQARHHGEALVSGCLRDLLHNGDSVIRLLSEGVGEASALHPVNVMVVSLLLGRALGMKGSELHELGMAALLHDLGKLSIPAGLAQPAPSLTPAERERYESHVGHSVALAQHMDLSEAVLIAIAQHHEMVDGSGFPLHLLGEDMRRAGKILALVNHYDRMCNPVGGTEAMTPHEALSVIFAQLKACFDSVVLGAFIRMMGVYPPGSVVQLVNDRYAIVVSVNSSRPLRPKVIVHDSRVPKDEAPVLDLETVPELGIRRSLKPSQLPRDALDYLSPRKRICYFFERAVDPGPDEAQA